MRRRFFLFCSIYVTLIASLSAQQVELVHRFPFGQPFGFIEKWDPNEGMPAGPSAIDFQINNFVIGDSTGDGSWRIFGTQNFNQLTVITNPSSGFRISPLQQIALGSRWNQFTIYAKGNFPTVRQHFIDTTALPSSERLHAQTPPYLVGNYLFAQTTSGELICWEFLQNEKIRYRGVQETKSWLTGGQAEQVGYRKDANGYTYFGDFTMENRPLNGERIWKDLIYPEKGPVRNTEGFQDFEYLGGDDAGLSYYLKITPHPNSEKIRTFTAPISVTVGVVDTWTRKVVFRILPAGSWNPPRSEKLGLLGWFPWAVHPSGDLYFFDADMAKKEYQLKRLKNDWWAELGVDKRKIGRITENHVALRKEPNTTATANGYNYENEFVWVIEESKKNEIVEGKQATWMKVRKVDGREGWVLSSEIRF